MNIAVLGSGGREHAICWALAKSPKIEALYAIPGNGGTAAVAENVAGLDICDAEALVGFAQDRNIDLVVIGPEAPLVAGMADALWARRPGRRAGRQQDGRQRIHGRQPYSHGSLWQLHQ